MRWLLVAALAVGCARGGVGRSRCEAVCAKEAECFEKLEPGFDVSECVEECQALDRDPASKPLVDSHVTCVAAAKGCAAVIECP